MDVSDEPSVSKAVFRVVFVVTATLAVILLALFPFQEPGSEGRIISIFSLAVQAVVCAIALAGLYFDWDPFGSLVDL